MSHSPPLRSRNSQGGEDHRTKRDLELGGLVNARRRDDIDRLRFGVWSHLAARIGRVGRGADTEEEGLRRRRESTRLIRAEPVLTMKDNREDPTRAWCAEGGLRQPDGDVSRQ